jgi:hypothetical protein
MFRMFTDLLYSVTVSVLYNVEMLCCTVALLKFCNPVSITLLFYNVNVMCR